MFFLDHKILRTARTRRANMQCPCRFRLEELEDRTLPTITLPFSDDFNRPDSTLIGNGWVEQQGDFEVGLSRLLPTSGTTSLATLDQLQVLDVSVSVDVDVFTGHAGLVARYSGPGESSLYLGALVAGNGNFTGQIWRSMGGTWALLSSGSAASGSGTLRFEVSGSALGLYLDGHAVTNAQDSSITTPGSAGLRANDGGFNNFSVTAAAVAPTLPFTDDFNREESTIIGNGWVEQQGDFELGVSRLLPVSSTTSLVTLDHLQVLDVSVSVDVDVFTGHAGLVARYAGPGENHLYLGALVGGGTQFTGQIWRSVGGVWTLLSSSPASSGSGTLRFDVIGSTLGLYMDGQSITSVQDTSITTAGSVGLRANDGGFNNFSAAETAFAPSLPFSDDFNRADGTIIGNGWIERQGDFQLQSSRLLPTSGTTSLTTLSELQVLDVSVGVDVDVFSGHAGLVARYSNSAGGNLYLGALVSTGSQFTGQIWRSLGGSWMLLSSKPAAGGSGTLRFDVTGSSLALYLDDQIVTSAQDGAITAPGSVGLRANDGGFNNFSAEEIAATPTLPFNDNFNRANSTAIGNGWAERQGDFQLQSSRLVPVPGTTALATVGQLTALDVALSADIELQNGHVGLVARCSSPQTGDLYLGAAVASEGEFSGQIWKSVGGAWTWLRSGLLPSGTGTLRFEVVGSSLRLLFDDQSIAIAQDNSITAAGSIGVRASSGSLDNFSASTGTVSQGSFDGDLAADLIGRANGQLWVAVAKDDHFDSQIWGEWSTDSEWENMNVGDFNGDGLRDVVGRDQLGDWWVGLSDGTRFQAQKWGQWSPAARWRDVQVADVDGDGRDDLVGRTFEGDWWTALARSAPTGDYFLSEWWTRWSSDVRWSDVATADVNGDGKSDILGRADNGQWWVGVSNGNGFENQSWGSWYNQIPWHDVQMGDIDGDGLGDIVGRSDDGNWWAAVSTGTSFQNEYWGHWDPQTSWRDVKTADVNGDGRTDLLGRDSDSGDWLAALSNGSSFAQETWGSWTQSASWHDVTIADVNGDGRDDVVGRNEGNWWVGLSTTSGLENQLWGSWPEIPWSDVTSSQEEVSNKLDELPATGFPAGTVISEINDALAELIDELLAEVDELQALGTDLIDASALREELLTTKEEFEEYDALVDQVINGQTPSVSLGPELLLDQTTLDRADRLVWHTMLDITGTPDSVGSNLDSVEDIRALGEAFYTDLVVSLIDDSRTAVTAFSSVLATASGFLAPVVQGMTAMTLAGVSAALESGIAMIHDDQATVQDYAQTADIFYDYGQTAGINMLTQRINQDSSAIDSLVAFARSLQAVAAQFNRQESTSTAAQIVNNYEPLKQRTASDSELYGTWSGPSNDGAGMITVIIAPGNSNVPKVFAKVESSKKGVKVGSGYGLADIFQPWHVTAKVKGQFYFVGSPNSQQTEGFVSATLSTLNPGTLGVVVFNSTGSLTRQVAR